MRTLAPIFAMAVSLAGAISLSGCRSSSINGHAGNETSAGSTTAGVASTSGSGTGGGSSSSGAETSSGTSGGSSSGTTGGAPPIDAGFCLIDGQQVAAGTWLDPNYGSCTVCDPASNDSDWTDVAGGAACRGFATDNAHEMSEGPDSLPFEGHCLKVFAGAHSTCTCILFGEGCGGFENWACCGGTCDADGGCQITQNIGWMASCNLGSRENACAQGPCCPDAGYAVHANAGWCCGLGDAGLPACLKAGDVCYASADCCAGLSCQPAEVIFDAGESYGRCE